jgi:hypothetical protein
MPNGTSGPGGLAEGCVVRRESSGAKGSREAWPRVLDGQIRNQRELIRSRVSVHVLTRQVRRPWIRCERNNLPAWRLLPENRLPRRPLNFPVFQAAGHFPSGGSALLPRPSRPCFRRPATFQALFPPPRYRIPEVVLAPGVARGQADEAFEPVLDAPQVRLEAAAAVKATDEVGQGGLF